MNQSGKDKDDNVVTLEEILETDSRNVEDEIDLIVKIANLKEKIETVLTKREKYIIGKRFGLSGDKPETQNKIAKDLGISRSYVSRIETKAIKKLSNNMEK